MKDHTLRRQRWLQAPEPSQQPAEFQQIILQFKTLIWTGQRAWSLQLPWGIRIGFRHNCSAPTAVTTLLKTNLLPTCI